MGLCEPWASAADVCSPCNDYALDTGILDEKLLTASEVLYTLSGSQWPGECEETLRPCSSRAPLYTAGLNIPGYRYNFSPYPYYGGMIACGCNDWDTCSCSPLSQLRLPRRDVTEISEVKVDGDVLPDTDYRLDPPNLLVSTITTRWPCCQDLRLDDDQPGTWSVTYSYGLAPPGLGVDAAAVLGCELYMACEPEAFPGLCRLPSNVISVARQGVTIAKLVGELFIPRKGQPVRFGIPQIDLFLATYAPTGQPPSIIVSPDDPDVGRLVGT